MSAPDTPLVVLVRDLLRFADAAAGEGISIEGAPAPEDILFDYATATGDEDCETYADRLPALLAAPPSAGVGEVVEAARRLRAEHAAWHDPFGTVTLAEANRRIEEAEAVLFAALARLSAEERPAVSAPDTHLIEEAITAWFGARCPDYAGGCAACMAWEELDALLAAPPQSGGVGEVVKAARELDAAEAAFEANARPDVVKRSGHEMHRDYERRRDAVKAVRAALARLSAEESQP